MWWNTINRLQNGWDICGLFACDLFSSSSVNEFGQYCFLSVIVWFAMAHQHKMYSPNILKESYGRARILWKFRMKGIKKVLCAEGKITELTLETGWIVIADFLPWSDQESLFLLLIIKLYRHCLSYKCNLTYFTCLLIWTTFLLINDRKRNHLSFKRNFQKQPSRGILRKRCSKNKCDLQSNFI